MSNSAIHLHSLRMMLTLCSRTMWAIEKYHLQAEKLDRLGFMWVSPVHEHSILCLENPWSGLMIQHHHFEILDNL